MMGRADAGTLQSTARQAASALNAQPQFMGVSAQKANVLVGEELPYRLGEGGKLGEVELSKMG